MIYHGKNCTLYVIFNTPEIAANSVAILPLPHAPATSKYSALFKTNSGKPYAPVITLSINNNIKFLEKLKQRF